MAFIIENYNRFDSWDRAHSKYVFEINGQWYAIKEVEMEWGLPQLQQKVDQDEYPESYRVYSEYKDALKFAQLMKELAR